MYPESHLTDRTLIVACSNTTYNEERRHSIKVEDKILDLEIEYKKWSGFCFELHSESSLFFVKLSVSMFIITICGYQLVTQRECDYQSLYSSLLSSVITFWLSKK